MSCCYKTHGGRQNLRSLVREYVKDWRACRRKELEYFASQPSFLKTVAAASVATDWERKRFRHQRRLSKKAIFIGRRILIKNLKRLQRCKSFQALHALIVDLVQGKKYGLGELYSYDTALRIGAKRRLKPDTIYMHAGTRVGASKLGLPFRDSFIPVKFLNAKLPELRGLRPHEIENFLCLFEKRFGRL